MREAPTQEQIAEAYDRARQLGLTIKGRNRELAQLIFDHPQNSAPVIAGWLGCGQTRVKELRRWAKSGFDGAFPGEGTRRFPKEDDDDEQFASGGEE